MDEAKADPQDKLDISDCGEKVKEIISKHLESNGVINWISPITLFKADFEKEIQKNMSDEAVASSMEHAAKNVINVKMDETPVYFTSLLEKLLQILDETKNDWAEKKARFKEFIDRELKSGQEDEANELGLTTKEFAVFETLRKVLEGKDEDSSKVAEEEAIYSSDVTTSFAVEFQKSLTRR